MHFLNLLLLIAETPVSLSPELSLLGKVFEVAPRWAVYVVSILVLIKYGLQPVVKILTDALTAWTRLSEKKAVTDARNLERRLNLELAVAKTHQETAWVMKASADAVGVSVKGLEAVSAELRATLARVWEHGKKEAVN